MVRRHTVLLSLTLLALCACASQTPPPVADIAVTTATIDDAEHNGAVEFAPIQLQTARDKLAGAQQAVRDNDNDLATSLAAEAAVEAKLAQVTAEAGHAQKSASAVQQTIETLHSTANQTVIQ